MDIELRRAVDADLPTITEIYNTVIVDSHISFDTEPHSVEERRGWFEGRQGTGLHQVWVATNHDDVIGIAYSGPWRGKDAYARSVETTIVLDPGWTGMGIGKRLYTALLDALVEAGAHRAYAIVALPNEQSVDLHHTLGFRTVGVLDEVGHKMGRWWSTELLEKRLA